MLPPNPPEDTPPPKPVKAAAPGVAPPGAKKTTKKPTKKRPLAEAASSSSGQRKGAWLKAEWQFASMAKDHWIRGLLPACFEGLQLRAALAKLLKCDPMRVSKRADLGGSGGKTYKVAATEQELEAAAMERAPLEAAFDAACLDPLAPKAPRAPKKRPRADTAESPSEVKTWRILTSTHSTGAGAPARTRMSARIGPLVVEERTPGTSVSRWAA